MKQCPTQAELLEAKPGDILVWDYRPPDAIAGVSATPRALVDVPLRTAQWNIERGYKLPLILQTLKRIDADVITLQELDIGCERSDFADVADEIAKTLSAQLVFAVEFEEFDCPSRSHENRCGQQKERGMKALHGNAIVSKHFSLNRPTLVEHSWRLDWDKAGTHFKEPRTGFRSFLRCEIEAGTSSNQAYQPMHLFAIYTLHLEIFHCGPLSRARQLGDALHDATTLLEKTKLLSPSTTFHVFIGGDLNTIGHSIVRCSGKYNAQKRMRFLSIGENESTWLQRKVLSRNIPGETSLLQQWVTNSDWLWKYLYSFSTEDLQRIRNTSLFMWDPFNKYADTTMNNPLYHGLVQGKLDWSLFSNVIVQRTSLENNDYSESDHKLLVVDIVLPFGTTAKETYVPWKRHFVGEFLPYFVTRVAAIAALCYLISRNAAAATR
ncbi:endonuclease/exonuclease/phosphatase, putative [Bodo saltans]|uniref:Endonuclease/exonuclease/phosphatase, putative n=1 Tax=Bodo saltans TaxID=75058 RepID=A0A0S4JD46_BODSA|nr:endonuclease/exonuclease/phosphatase, putative [Bodo saltans]|eukprot:CUG87957.1 endonuclease/exonuclease/phosphatase, putative [Bodo saltans]